MPMIIKQIVMNKARGCDFCLSNEAIDLFNSLSPAYRAIGSKYKFSPGELNSIIDSESRKVVWDYDIPRDDKTLIKVVTILKEAANGPDAKIHIANIHLTIQNMGDGEKIILEIR